MYNRTINRRWSPWVFGYLHDKERGLGKARPSPADRTPKGPGPPAHPMTDERRTAQQRGPPQPPRGCRVGPDPCGRVRTRVCVCVRVSYVSLRVRVNTRFPECPAACPAVGLVIASAEKRCEVIAGLCVLHTSMSPRSLLCQGDSIELFEKIVSASIF